MENKVNYAAVGLFVIGLITAIIFMIIWLSSGLKSQSRTSYKIYMTEAVSGLSIDSTVEFNGVSVGSVKSIELDPKIPKQVTVIISIRSDTPVTKGTRATLNIKGLTGNAYISLQDKGLDTEPLIKLKGEPYPVIETSPSLLFRLDKIITGLTADVHNVTLSLKTLLNPENQQAIQRSLANIEILTRALAHNSNQFNTIMSGTAKATQQFPTLIETSTQTLSDFQTTSANISALSNEIKQNPAMMIRGKAPRTLGPGE